MVQRNAQSGVVCRGDPPLSRWVENTVVRLHLKLVGM